MKWWEWSIIGGVVLVTWLIVLAGMTARPSEISVDLRDAEGRNLCGEIEASGCSASLLGTGSCTRVQMKIIPCEVRT